MSNVPHVAAAASLIGPIYYWQISMFAMNESQRSSAIGMCDKSVRPPFVAVALCMSIFKFLFVSRGIDANTSSPA